MAQGKTVAEHAITMACARTTKAMRKLATADRQSEHAAEAARVARAEAVKAIAAAMPLLTTEQREQLRPILAGTIPADTARTTDTAA